MRLTHISIIFLMTCSAIQFSQANANNVSPHFYSPNGNNPQIHTPEFWQKRRNFESNMPPTHHLSNEMLKDYNRLAKQSKDFRLHIIADRQGASGTYQAAMILPPKVRQTMHIYAIGADFLIAEKGFGKATNYVNKSTEAGKKAMSSRDPKENYTIVDTPQSLHHQSSWKILEAHSLECQGYQWALDEITREIKETENLFR